MGIQFRIWFLLILLRPFVTSWFNLVRSSAPNRRIGRIGRVFVSKETPWWGTEGLPFSCTGCGKCCVSEGEVWMDSDEFLDLTDHLGKKPDECLEFLSSVQASGWVKLKDREADSKLGLGRISQCHFLGDDGKTCQIYEARPTQCYSFPYWPRLIESKEAWDEEAVVPDDVQGKHWSASSGGCEGMNHPESNRAEFKEIKVNSELYKAYHSTFFEDTTLIKNEDEHTATFMGIVDVKNSEAGYKELGGKFRDEV